MVEGWPLDYWDSEEWHDVQTSLYLLEQRGELYLPLRDDMFRSLDLVSLSRCRVCILGQDPYPDPAHATGVAFESRHGIPASLRTLFREYARDLSLEYPSTGSLRRWTNQGVLLWNVTPTVGVKFVNGRYVPVTHEGWKEWYPLTQEIVERLSAKGGIVFAFFGSRAKNYAQYVDTNAHYNSVLFCSHPSPRAQASTQSPFSGSRFFTTVNYHLLNVHCKEPIDWRLE